VAPSTTIQNRINADSDEEITEAEIDEDTFDKVVQE
jgi:hypothetical protein